MNKRIIIILELIAIIGLYFWYIQPTYSGPIQTINKNIASEHANKISIQQYIQHKTQLTQKQNNIPALDLSRLSNMLPSSNNTMHFLLNLNALALRSGFIINKFNIDNQNNNQQSNTIQTQQKIYRTFIVGISGEGTYASFRQFLDSLERSLRLVDVISISIKNNNINTTSDTDKQTALYNYSLTLQIYWIPPAS